MTYVARRATEADLDVVVALTQASRRRLAGWAPRWWAVADGADEIHPLWLQHLIASDGPVARVVEDDAGTVVGCAIAVPQPGQWFVDDVAVVDDERWADAGAALLDAVAERPALTCIAPAHTARIEASVVAGIERVSSYWIGELDAVTAPRSGTGSSPPGGVGVPVDAVVAAPPPHTFGGALDPWAEGALAFVAPGGLVVGSPPTAPPPIYGSGGTVAVVDRVVGPDRGALVDLAIGAAAARGDVLIAVVVGVGDTELAELAGTRGLVRSVDVHAWPPTT